MARFRKCSRCGQHLQYFLDDVCDECREEERQRNYGE